MTSNTQVCTCLPTRNRLSTQRPESVLSGFLVIQVPKIMNKWLTFLFFFGLCIVLASSETTFKPQRTRRPRDPNCERSRPLESKQPGARAKCTFVCKGSPLRIGHEPDGTACTRRGKKRAPGICQGGKCVNPENLTV